VGASIPANVQTGPGTETASCKVGTVSFPEVSPPGCQVDHPHPSKAEVKERVVLYLYFTFGPSWPVIERILP
jgi:hypothetical protein